MKFWNLLVIEQQKTLGRLILWLGIGLLASLVLLSMVSMAGSHPPADIVQRQVIWPMVLVNYLRQFAANSLITGLIVVTLTGAVVAQEYQWRTLNHLLGRGVSRWRYILAKWCSLLLPVVLIVLIPMIVAIAVSAFYTTQFIGYLNFTQVNFVNLGISILLGAYALLPYATFALMLAILSRSTIASVAGGVGFLIVETIIWQLLYSIGDAGKTIAQWFPMSLSMGVLKWSQSIAAVVPTGVGGYEYWNNYQLIPFGTACILIAVYSIIILLVSYLSFLRQDLS